MRGFSSLKRNPRFFRKGTVDGWKDDLSPNEVRTVEYIAQDLMQALGYQRSLPVPRPSKPLRVAVHDGLETVEGGVRRVIEATFQRIRSLA